MLSLITFGVDCPVLLYSRSWIKRVIPVPWPLRLRMANALDARVDQLEQNLDRLWTRVERTEDRLDRLRQPHQKTRQWCTESGVDCSQSGQSGRPAPEYLGVACQNPWGETQAGMGEGTSAGC